MQIQRVEVSNLKRKVLFPLGLVGIGLFLLSVNSIMSFKKEIPLNVTDSLLVSFEGENGKGLPVLEKKINYDGKNESVLSFIKNLTYQITPNSGLSNGDTVVVKAVYDKHQTEMVGIVPEEPERRFVVEGLYEVRTDEETNTTYIDDLQIPDSMNGSEEDRKLYLDYMNAIANGSSDEADLSNQWLQGQESNADIRANRTFLKDDYQDYGNEAFDQANEYGRSSSQEYMVKPVVLEEKVIGWETIFKPGE